tara:strand:+ start:1689 stop:2789 length:1101 start_codon:yes stop_codon:yes gene_type:complete
MARNRVIYQSEALYVSKNAASTGQADHKQLERVQSANFNYTINRQDVNQFGQLARIDSLVLDPPTVGTDFSYYLTDGFNERCLGFYVKTGGGIRASDGGFASGHLLGGSGFNSFIVTGPDGKDLNRQTLGATDHVIGIGNCYLSDYSVDLSVGSLPTVSVTLEGANVRSDDSANSISTPAIDQEAGTSLSDDVELPPPTTGAASTITALRPGDITVSLSNIAGETVADLAGDDGAHVQSVSISVPLSRSPIDRLGSKFPFARAVDFPVNVTMGISAIVNETIAMNLVDTINSGAQNVTVTLKGPDGATDAVIYDLKGVKVDSESFSSAIGSNQTVDLSLSAQIGGPADTSAGLFMSGVSKVAGPHE